MSTAVAARVEAVLARLRGRQIHVLGPSGTEGSAVLDFLLAHGITTITAHDLEPAARFAATVDRTHPWLDPAGRAALVARLRAGPVAWRQGPRYLEGLEQAEIVFAPQSWFRYPQNAPVRAAVARGIPLWSLTRLCFEVHPGPVLGVTGTNGKFTVVTLLGAMLEAAGIPAVVSGNDRTHVPAVYALERLTPQTWLVLELSNRQLVGLPYSPHVAVVTNIAAHHLDDHGSLEAYVEAKRTIVRHQRATDHAVLNADDPLVAGMASGLAAQVHWFSRRRAVAPGAYLADGWLVLAGRQPVRVLEAAALAVPGDHMVENALAAMAAAAVVGVPPEAMAQALCAFRGLPYRCRLVAERGGVAFYEDSLATNPAAAAAAIRSMRRPVHLIAGGYRRAPRVEEFRPMGEALAAIPTRGVYLIGAAAPVLAAALAPLAQARGVGVVQAQTLERAVAAAWAAARPGEAVLLSPGCESFDQFADYRERGDRFVHLVEALPAQAAWEAGR